MRLDIFLYTNGYFQSRNKAAEAILRGEVYLNGVKILKPSFLVNGESNCNIEIVSENNFVSVGGYKLYKALKDFDFSVKGLVCADVGASTGGFTDCLLQNGAEKVYAVDLNDELLSEKLKCNPKVVELTKNAKFLKKEDFQDEIDLIVADLSFISEKAVLPVFKTLLKEAGRMIILIKPQFEMGEKRKFKNGIVSDEKARNTVVNDVILFAKNIGLKPLNLTEAPIKEGKNIEYLLLLSVDN